MVLNFLGILLAGTVSVMAVKLVIRRAGQLGLVQHANQRSSHTRPTPTGGGIGIVAGTIVGGGLICLGDVLLLQVLGLALVIALLGLIDDRWLLPAKLRLMVQFGALSVFVVFSGGPLLLAANVGETWLIPIAVAMIIAGVWWVNLFNFMDGIDGFAASQALCMLASALVLTLLSDRSSVEQPLFWLMFSVGAATLGFLLFNWPPAKIFMGDIGSLFLGFSLFTFAILSADAGWLSLWQWAILGAVFASDATMTLARRLLRRKRIMQAHKSHAYQQLARKSGGHQHVSQMLVGTNLLILLPLSWAAGQWTEFAWLITVGSYTGLHIAAFAYDAGLET